MMDFVERWIPSEEYLPNNRTSSKGRFLAITINPIAADDGTHRCLVTNRFELRTQFESMGLTGGSFSNIDASKITAVATSDPRFKVVIEKIVGNVAAGSLFVGPLLGPLPFLGSALGVPVAKGYSAGITGAVELMEDNGTAWAARDAIDFLLDMQFPQVALEELTGKFGSQVMTPVNFSWKEEPEVGSDSEGAEDQYPQIDLAYKVMTRGGGDAGLKSFIAAGVELMSVEAFNSLEVCLQLIDRILDKCDSMTAQVEIPGRLHQSPGLWIIQGDACAATGALWKDRRRRRDWAAEDTKHISAADVARERSVGQQVYVALGTRVCRDEWLAGLIARLVSSSADVEERTETARHRGGDAA